MYLLLYIGCEVNENVFDYEFIKSPITSGDEDGNYFKNLLVIMTCVLQTVKMCQL